MDKQFNPFSLEGKTILITGASSGIGRQCAIDCSKIGAKVIAIGRDKTKLQKVCEEMTGNNDSYSYDLNNIEGIQDLIRTITQKHGKFDGFIHAAGIEVTSPFKLTKPEDYKSLHRVNCLSAFEMVRNLCGIKTFNHGGGVIFIGSISSLIARKGLTAYAASKGALISAAKVMALEMAQRGIRVNVISPGTILTPMMKEALDTMTKEERDNRIEGFPLGLGQTTDISNACIYLLSDASKWVTGINLVVDGGYTIK